MDTPSHRFSLATHFFAWSLGVASIYLSGGLLSGLAHAAFEGMEQQVLKYEGIFAYVPQRRNVMSGDAARLCEALRINSLRWRLPNSKEVRETIKVKDSTAHMFWIEKDAYGYACNGPANYFRDRIDDMHCLTVCVAEDVATVRPTAALPPVTEKPKKLEAQTIKLTKIPDDNEQLKARAADQVLADREYAKVLAQKEQVKAKEESARQASAFQKTLERRKQCMEPRMRGQCDCISFQVAPPGGWKACGK